MQVNCFFTAVEEGGEPSYCLEAISGVDVAALKFDGRRYEIPTTLSLDRIDPATLRVTHHYGLDDIRYEGIRAVAWGLWTRWPYAALHLQRLRNRVAQRLFNRRSLVVRRRLDILRDVISATMGGEESVDPFDLMSARHGSRWAGHPAWASHHDLLARHLDLLVETGDLAKQSDGRYRATGQGLKTLQDSDEEDRKHKASQRVQWLLAVLTLISAVMAAAQAGLLKLPTVLDLSRPAPGMATADAAQQAAAANAGSNAAPASAPTSQRPVSGSTGGR